MQISARMSFLMAARLNIHLDLVHAANIRILAFVERHNVVEFTSVKVLKLFLRY